MKSWDGEKMKKLLVIDDNTSLNYIITSIFKRENFDVDCAYSGKEGLALLMQNEYDALITDLNLPDISGIDILTEIQEKKIAKVMVAAYCDSSILEKLEIFQTKFIEKPFQNSELVKTIKESIG